MVRPALSVLSTGGLFTGGENPVKPKNTVKLALRLTEFPLRSTPVTVNVCGPGLLVSSRPPLWIGEPLSVLPVQLLTPPGSEQSKVAWTCWFSVNVPLGSGCEISSDGESLSGTD